MIDAQSGVEITEDEQNGPFAGILLMVVQRRMRRLGNVVRMDDGRIPEDLLCRELVQEKRPTSRPQLRY